MDPIAGVLVSVQDKSLMPSYSNALLRHALAKARRATKFDEIGASDDALDAYWKACNYLERARRETIIEKDRNMLLNIYVTYNRRRVELETLTQEWQFDGEEDLLEVLGYRRESSEARSKYCALQETLGEDLEKSTSDEASVPSVDLSTLLTTSVETLDQKLITPVRSYTIALRQNLKMGLIFKEAMRKVRRGSTRPENNFCRLLRHFSSRLMRSSRSVDAILAASAIHHHSSFVANKFQAVFGYRHDLEDAESRLNRYYIRRMLAERDHRIEGGRGNLRETDFAPGIGSDEVEITGSTDRKQNQHCGISALLSCMFMSEEFQKLCADMWNIVEPTLKFRLSTLLPKITYTTVEVSSLEDQNDTFSKYKNLMNEWKKATEDFTGVGWNWWPLQQHRPRVGPGCMRLQWQCSCGEYRYEDVPKIFGDCILRGMRSLPSVSPFSPQQLALPAGNVVPSETPTRPTASESSSNDQNSSATSMTSLADATTANNPSKTGALSANRMAQTTPDHRSKDKGYVFLIVAVGDNFCLNQIRVLRFKDDEFFAHLKQAYVKTKGFVRSFFGIWVYDRCDFYKFEKFDEEEHVPRGKDIPDPQNLAYRYSPKPITEDPPITPHEFNRRFYSCRRTCWLSRHHLRNPFHKCKGCKKLNVSCDAVVRIPKRQHRLETSGDAREIFWGLYAIDSVSFFRVSVYLSIAVIPSLVFLFLWIFIWKHSGDLQNASVPFLCVVGTISIFRYRERKAVNTER